MRKSKITLKNGSESVKIQLIRLDPDSQRKIQGDPTHEIGVNCIYLTRYRILVWVSENYFNKFELDFCQE